jgi:general secretion pathway protein A
MLMGQPELDVRLDSPDWRHFQQRVALRCRLQPLTKQEMKQYIRRRLELAGGTRTDLFSEPALDELYSCVGGIPRLINILCENCLICGSAMKVSCVTPEIVQEIAADFHLGLPPGDKTFAPKYASPRGSMPGARWNSPGLKDPPAVAGNQI